MQRGKPNSLTEALVDGREARFVPCSLCVHEATATVFARDGFFWQRCTHCGLVRVNPQLTQDAIAGIYSAGYDDKRRTVAAGEAVLPFHRTILDRLADICGSPGRLLDVGCFEGRFLRDARELGWNVTGTEISAQAVQFASEKRGLDVRLGPLASHSFPSDSFDAAVLLDVIEHLPDPRRTLEEIARVLRPGGALYVWTPNFDCPARWLAGARWGAVVFPWHLYYFTPATLKRMVVVAGLKTRSVATRNWLLDFGHRYGALSRGQSLPEQPRWARRGRRILDTATAPVFDWLDRRGRHWGAQMELWATREDRK